MSAVPPSIPPVPPSPDASRLAWLDALRGVAALAVAVHHAGFHYIPQTRAHVLAWFDPGTFGVLVFFLVSGYIVPASLERSGSVRRFWISRVFRIYPLLVVAVGAAVLLAVTGQRPLQARLGNYDTATAVLAHIPVLQDLLGVPSAINVLWTLSYEMAFYLLVVALFTIRLHRRSAQAALLLALGGLLGGGVLPRAALTEQFGLTPVVVVAAVVFLAAVGAAWLHSAALATAGALLGGLLGVALVVFNGRVAAWEGLTVIAVMFTGTVIYRAERGQIDRRRAGSAAAAVLVCAVAAGAWWIDGNPASTRWESARAWAGAVLAAALLFALFMALRHRRMPRSLGWLGLVSYSVYLLHPVLLVTGDVLFGRPQDDTFWLLPVFLAVLLAVSWLTYRTVEAPMQQWGRRLARRAAVPASPDTALPAQAAPPAKVQAASPRSPRPPVAHTEDA